MIELKSFAIPFGLLMMGLWVWLLWASPKTLIMAFAVTVVMMIVLYRNDQIVEMVVEPRRILVRMQEIREEIFAKADEVRAMAASVGKMAAFSIGQVGRLPPENLQAVLLKQRDELEQMLKEAKVAEERVREITSPITETVLNDLAGNAARAAWQSTRQGSEHEVVADLNKRLKESNPGQALSTLRPHLERIGAWNDAVRSHIKVFDDFRVTGVLSEVKPQTPQPGGFGFGPLR